MGVTREHEAPMELLDDEPELLLDLLPMLGWPYDPKAVVTCESERATQIQPTEFYVDGVRRIRFSNGDRLTVAFEVQRARDPDKVYSWPLYAAKLWAQWKQPVAVLVWCLCEKVAEWAREPIDMGPFGTVAPVVIAPADSAALADDDPRSVGKARWAALANQRTEEFPKRATALALLVDELADTDPKRARDIDDNMRAALNDSARRIWEGTMTTMASGYRLKSDIAQAAREEGHVEGEARSLIRVLNRRDVALSDSDLERITACTDQATLDEWLDRAVTAETIADVFGRPA